MSFVGAISTNFAMYHVDRDGCIMSGHHLAVTIMLYMIDPNFAPNCCNCACTVSAGLVHQAVVPCVCCHCGREAYLTSTSSLFLVRASCASKFLNTSQCRHPFEKIQIQYSGSPQHHHLRHVTADDPVNMFDHMFSVLGCTCQFHGSQGPDCSAWPASCWAA